MTSGPRITSPRIAPTRSISRLQTSCQDDFRRCSKNQQRFPAEIVHSGPGDGGLYEVGHQPGLDAFDFAGHNRFFDFTECGLGDVEDHATDGVAVQHLGKFREQIVVGVEFGGDAQAPFGVLVQQPGKLGIALLRSHQNDFRDLLAAAGTTGHVRLENTVLHIQRDDTEQPEQRDDAAAELRLPVNVERCHNREQAARHNA